jgi:hypothetical protein
MVVHGSGEDCSNRLRSLKLSNHWKLILTKGTRAPLESSWMKVVGDPSWEMDNQTTHFSLWNVLGSGCVLYGRRARWATPRLGF